ncbi:hypothetical protein D5F01_LYC22215 [Larimichthys crocea]|uniref:Uncharacterized protein n=1 Tax=Larimichthys crocea TaxID=215358 RepID=A0A6G0HLF7_LARCR|nr:hypothetical protein D5F01_LYC22215 [Larimichthys crocea]
MTDLHLHCLGFRRAAPPPVPLWVLQRTTEGLGYKGTRTTVGGAERGQERIGVEKRKREREGKEGGEVTRAVRGAPNQRCVNRPPPGVDRLQGGVLHGPLGLSAEQITDGRNVAFVLKKRRGRALPPCPQSVKGAMIPVFDNPSTTTTRCGGL